MMMRVLELLSRAWLLVVVRGVLAIIFGLLAIVWPGITLLVLALMFGIYTLVDGIASVAMGVGRGEDRVYPIVIGVLGIIAGVVTLVWPHITVIVLLLVIAIWAIVVGVTEIASAVRLRKKIDNEWFLALSGVLALVLGLLLVVQPAVGAIALVTAIATFAVVWGLTLVVLGFRLRILRRQFT